MATRFRDTIFSPLSATEARALVADVATLIDASISAEASDGAPVDSGIDGFSVVTERGERDDDGYTELDVFDDVSLEMDESPPPTAEAHRLVRAAGAAWSSSAFDPTAMSRLSSCRSTVTLEHCGRVWDKRPFVALQKLVFARVGAAVVSCGEAGDAVERHAGCAQLKTIETLVAERAKNVGPRWAAILPLGSSESPQKKPRKTRPAKRGELESLKIYKRLARMIEGKDPLARDLLKSDLERTTESVRSYAAALMEDGPKPAAAVAKSLRCAEAEVVASRAALRELLNGIQ